MRVVWEGWVEGRWGWGLKGWEVWCRDGREIEYEGGVKVDGVFGCCGG